MQSPRDRLVWSLIAYAGLRTEEALALRWEDVSEHTIVVDRAFTHGEQKPTKTHQRRTVEIMAPLRADIEEWRALCDDVGLLARSRVGGFLHLGNWRRRVFKPACEAAGITANPYDGRHSYASLLIHAGRSPLAVAAAMGHASAETTWKHYAHLFEEVQLASSCDPEEAIWEARRKVWTESSVRPVCDEVPVRHLRLVG